LISSIPEVRPWSKVLAITTTTTVQGGEGSRRWRLAEEQTPQFLAFGEGSWRWRLA